MIWIPIAAIILIMVFVIIIKAMKLRPIEHRYRSIGCEHEINEMIAAEKLSEIIQCRTISHSDYDKFDFSEFIKLRELLEKNFPLVHESLNLSVINDYSLLYEWKGCDEKLKPGLFMAHQDVVPVEKGTEDDWTHPPFSGDIEEGYLWGRGAMDIKIQLVSLLEACEKLLETGFSPNRSIYFAFGHDEETDGRNGAGKIVEKLKDEGVELEFINDEGGCINSGVFAAVKKPVAFIGIAEKGYLNIKTEISGEGGHSSTPPENSSLGLAAKAICRLESKKMKLRLTEPAILMIRALGRHMNFASRLIIANLWLFRPLFIKIFTTAGTTGEALLRTTIAPTMAKGSMEPNVLPQKSEFTVNCRILQGETANDVIEHITKACRGTEHELTVLRYEEPSEVSPYDSEFFERIAGAVRGIAPEAAIIPYLMVAGTDSIKYQEICSNIIRFSPFSIHRDDMKRIHGTNERISIENIGNCVKFYTALLETL